MLDSRITRVLGYWQPSTNLEDYSNNNKDLVIQQFQLHLFFYFVIETKIQSIHSPDNFLNWPKDLANWHQDGDAIDGKFVAADERFVVWSNVQPTDILFKDNSMLETKNGAIILISNLEVVHKTPTPLNPKRWLIRTDYLI